MAINIHEWVINNFIFDYSWRFVVIRVTYELFFNPTTRWIAIVFIVFVVFLLAQWGRMAIRLICC